MTLSFKTESAGKAFQQLSIDIFLNGVQEMSTDEIVSIIKKLADIKENVKKKEWEEGKNREKLKSRERDYMIS